MPKKKKQRDKGQQSKGLHCQNKSIYRAVRRERSDLEKNVNLLKEWRRGKNPWITINNPNDKDTRARKIRVKANDYYGDWKRVYMIKQQTVEEV